MRPLVERNDDEHPETAGPRESTLEGDPPGVPDRELATGDGRGLLVRARDGIPVGGHAEGQRSLPGAAGNPPGGSPAHCAGEVLSGGADGASSPREGGKEPKVAIPDRRGGDPARLEVIRPRSAPSGLINIKPISFSLLLC